ncbi:uncharacterized protein K460DRAFT_357193 [Cucurbitaria berberidis CBS 394.84]|uniref:Uncharacterized protein n=1 Tax=Cucurbitaria berberidis CBS 394.84 TaxID=1168544 RepID=A0A9P4GCP6_9PLEO|nr:uncharacterized protein K460DRAFT_357193 [Cucurbitaria berberidis CBS 394.84]KAF1843468.1 hypothetical protein K460DRAFT_357193 [Cucurbitaria berberidis CBS 394.84]
MYQQQDKGAPRANWELTSVREASEAVRENGATLPTRCCQNIPVAVVAGLGMGERREIREQLALYGGPGEVTIWGFLFASRSPVHVAALSCYRASSFPPSSLKSFRLQLWRIGRETRATAYDVMTEQQSNSPTLKDQGMSGVCKADDAFSQWFAACFRDILEPTHPSLVWCLESWGLRRRSPTALHTCHLLVHQMTNEASQHPPDITQWL